MGYVIIDEDMYEGRKTGLSNSDTTVMTRDYATYFLQAISTQSANPERAAMFLEMLNTDEELATMMRFGLEGEHYDLVDGLIDITNNEKNGLGKAPNERAYYYWYGGQFGNILAGKLPSTTLAGFPEALKDLNDNSIQNTNLGFAFDPEPVLNEIAACSAVINEYHHITGLMGGMISDVDRTVDEFVKKLEDNGAQKIVDEAQRQLNEWRASVGRTTK